MPSNLKISYLKISLNNNCGKNKIVKAGRVKFNPQLVNSKNVPFTGQKVFVIILHDQAPINIIYEINNEPAN